LTNVFANTWLGGQLFPYTHANRAAAVLFKPRSFIQRMETELRFEQPTLLVTHLCAAHWPYFVAEVPMDADLLKHDDDRPLYEIGLRTADAMLGEVIAMLNRKGALRNAIVVVLSDHGEGLAVRGDSLLGDVQIDRVKGLEVPVTNMDWGHGQSVLSPVQYQVLLGFRTFGQHHAYRASARTIDVPATVLDIKPTLLDMLGIAPEHPYSYGLSLKPLLTSENAGRADELRNRARFTETDLRATINKAGDIDENAAARENSLYFTVDVDTGRLELRPQAYPLLMAFKERAGILGSTILAAMPADIDHHQYLLINRHTGVGRVLQAAPAPSDDEAYRLWIQMQASFGDELKPPTVLRLEQVPWLTERWSSLIDGANKALAESGTGT
jgi:hypothetical protein